MVQSKPWTRNQKLILAGILVTLLLGIVGFIVKINIDISYIKDEIDNIKIKNAEIDSLKSDVAEIKELYAGDTEVGKFKSTCPEGTSARILKSSNGLEVVCE